MTTHLVETRGKKGTAVLSADARYRYRLARDLNGGQDDVVFLMLNPSTADADANDPTITRWGDGQGQGR